MTPRDLEELRRTLVARGIADAPVHETLGRSEGSIHLSPSAQPRVSQFPEALVDEDPNAEFAIRRELGRGGMATVWLAEQTSLGREVAIKRASDPEDQEAELLLLREATITGQLEHPNIVPVHLLVVDEHGPAVVLKRVSGQTWDSLIHAGETSLERHLEIFLQVINAVDFAHSRGVLHRDIKPANVMIGDFGEVYLMDWGVAHKPTDPPGDAVVGTPKYMAPEMADGHADERTDVFLLGATLHEVLTGEPRHKGETALMVLYAAMYVEPYDYGPAVPDELAAICNRACARAPMNRFANASELREAVLTFREHRAAFVLSEAAERRLDDLRALIAKRPSRENGHNGYGEAQRLFSEVRFGFEAALKIWPDSPFALKGLGDALRTMVDFELASRHPDAAQALLDSLRDGDSERARKLEQLRTELIRERDRFAAIERDRDPNVGAKGRARAYQLMGVASLLMTLVLLAQRLFFPDFRPSSLRLTVVGAVVLSLMLGIVRWWRRNGDWNFINRRIAEISVGTLAVSFANRLSGYILHAPPEHVLVNDALILGLGGATMAAYHRAGPWLAGMSFAVGILGSIWPAFVDDMFIGLSVFVPSAMLLLKRAGLVTPEGANKHPDA